MNCKYPCVLAVLSTVLVIATLAVVGLVWLTTRPIEVEHNIKTTTRPAGLVGTVSYTTSKPVTPMATTIDGTDYTNIKPSTVYTTVYIGGSKGVDTSTTGFKTGSYGTSSKPYYNSGRPYNFKHLPKFLRPRPTNGRLEP